MNVKIDQPIPESQVITTIPVGSQVYGTATVDSDSDYIKIISGPDTTELLQYQTNEVDYVYVTLDNFLRLVRNGGNIPMWEAALYMDFNVGGHDLSDFDWYAVIKAHLGLAKRDLAYYPDRLKHVCRSLSFAHIMMQGNLPKLEDVKWIPLIQDPAHLRTRVKAMRAELNKMYKKT